MKNGDALYLEVKDVEEQAWRGAGASDSMGGVSIQMGWEALCSECREKRGRGWGRGGEEEEKGREGERRRPHRRTWKEASEKGENQAGAQ